MDKIWILIFVLFPLFGFSQLKCFTPAEQIELLYQLDKAKTCDTLIENLKAQKDSLFSIVEKKNGIIEIKNSQIDLQKNYVQNLEQINSDLQTDLKKESRRKRAFQFVSFGTAIGLILALLG